MNSVKIILAVAMALACPGIVNADYWVKSCNGSSCSYHRVRTPVRNTFQTAGNVTRSAVQRVTTPVRGIFGRVRGYRTTYVEGPATSSYGSSGSYQAYANYGSSGSYDAYRTTETVTQAAPQTTAAVECDCNGECNCPCCPCRPRSEAKEKPTYQLSRTLKPREYTLARSLAPRPQDLRLASR